MRTAIEQLFHHKIVPVVTIHNAGKTDALADALLAGGLPCAEITLRTDAAADAIHGMARRGDMLVGAGTVLSVNQVQRAIDAGAVFIVAPGLNRKVVTYCLENRIPIIPGVATPTEIEMALDLGVTLLKFFPAEALGGLKTFHAVSAPYTMARFIPTGGINTENVSGYIRHPKVAACGGSWMVRSTLIDEGDFDRIANLTREAVQLVQDL